MQLQEIIGQPPATLKEAESRLRAITEAAGFDSFSYVGGECLVGGDQVGLGAWPSPILLNSVRPAWVRQYQEQDYGPIDPAIQAALVRRLPAAWDADRLIAKMPAPQSAFLAAAKDFNVARGFTIPVFGPREFALVSFISGDHQKEFDRNVAAFGHNLHLAAIYLHQYIMTLKPVDKSTRLTPREIEMLHWAAAGKTSLDTADILGIAEKTVKTHLYAAMQKLDVLNRAAAVAKAIKLGLITP